MKFSGINKSYTVDLLYHLSKLPKLRVTCPTVIGWGARVGNLHDGPPLGLLGVKSRGMEVVGLVHPGRR